MRVCMLSFFELKSLPSTQIKFWRVEEDCIHPASGVEKDPPANMKSKTGALGQC